MSKCNEKSAGNDSRKPSSQSQHPGPTKIESAVERPITTPEKKPDAKPDTKPDEKPNVKPAGVPVIPEVAHLVTAKAIETKLLQHKQS